MSKNSNNKNITHSGGKKPEKQTNKKKNNIECLATKVIKGGGLAGVHRLRCAWQQLSAFQFTTRKKHDVRTERR